VLPKLAGCCHLREAFVAAYGFGLSGLYYRFRRFLPENQNGGIGIRIPAGFFLTAAGFLLCPPIRAPSRLKFLQDIQAAACPASKRYPDHRHRLVCLFKFRKSLRSG
jgi:hypothetical protein